MAQVTLRINGHAHTIGCKDGEEAHLFAMAEEVEKRIDQAKALGVHSGEAKLLVMAALFMADELHDIGGRAAGRAQGQAGLVRARQVGAASAAWRRGRRRLRRRPSNTR